MSTTRPAPASLYTIPPGVSFVDALARGLLARFGGDAWALADITVLLPTRRACRALAEAFLRRSEGAALLLPRLMPIGDLEEDGFMPAADDEVAVADALDLPPAIPELRRRLLLTRAIMLLPPAGFGDGDGASDKMSPAQASLLAQRLGELLDQVQTERLNFDRLAGIVPEDHAAHWQVTLEFLKILTEHWPAVLAEEGCVDPATRRNRVIESRCRAWRASPPAAPVIAAGSTGSIPATADLIDVIAHLPAGMVVLPGLDTTLGGGELTAIGPIHPQFTMVRLLDRLGASPAEVRSWVGAGGRDGAPARVALVNAALAPPGPAPAPAPAPEKARATAAALAGGALAGVRLITCPGPQEEAAVISLALRRALEVPGRTAALVTPDRGLARRVAAELRRWEIEIDDSAGIPLADTPPGVFLRLAAEFAATDAAPLALLSLLKHPLAAGGIEPGAFRARARALELAALRGPRPAPGLEGLGDVVRRDGADGGLGDWLDRLAGGAAPFLAAMGRAGRQKFVGLMAAHVAFAEALAATATEPGAERLWAGEAGEAAATFIARLEAAAAGFAPVRGPDYPALFGVLMSGQVVRPAYGLHPRLHIWGPLEARLQHADLLCLGGLNEGTWPADPGADPWLSRPMRAAFGLPSLERRIGLAAHDFVQGFAAPEVLLTRAGRVEGTPSVPSRWLLKLGNALQAARGEGGPALLAPIDGAGGESWLGWQAALDRPEAVAPVSPPAPRPPVAARPRRLSVTQIETLMRDPYAIYARHILKLRPLDAIDADPGAAERGSMIHAAIERFMRAHPDKLPRDALAALLRAGKEAFGAALAQPGVWAFWWPRFERIAEWFVEHEGGYRNTIRASRAELRGALVIEAPGGNFTLIAKADRVDELNDGGLAIIDFKTGALPSTQDIALGFAPQLPLEAAIAAAGGFPELPACEAARLEFWRLTGGEPAGERIAAGHDAARLGREARSGLKRLIARFDDPATPYLSQPDPERAPPFSDYVHLARIQEWSVAGGGAAE